MPDFQPGEVKCSYHTSIGGHGGIAIPTTGGYSCPLFTPATLIALLECIHARSSGGSVTFMALLEAVESDVLPVAVVANGQPPPPCCNFWSLPNPTTTTSVDFLLGIAVKHNYLDSARELLKLGANAEAVDEIGLTPLLVATRARNTAAIAILIESGSADVNSRGQTVWSALHFAAHGGDPATIEALVTRGGDLSAKTSLEEKSPLHIAAGHAETRAVQELVLRWGADETQLDGRGRSASDIAGALKNVFDRGHNHAEEVEKIKAMLANAPAERRWSRRRAVVLLVSRLRGKIARERRQQVVEKEESSAAKKRGSGADGAEEGKTAAPSLGAAVIVAVEDPGDVEDSIVLLGGDSVTAKVGEQQLSMPAPAGMEAFRGAVTRLAREDDIGIFRSVVSFL